MTKRYFFEIRYNGSAYHGWQHQANAVGVQDVVEEALSTLARQPVEIVASGRTDAGVHCAQQFFHTDLPANFSVDDLLHRLNAFLPRDISIRSIRRVKESAHARYDARERAYVYRITRVKDPLLIGYAYHFFKPVDLSLMNRAAASLIGEHDFASFSKVKTDVNHFRCEITKATWKSSGDELTFEISANRFLRGMVRAIVGTLLDVGAGKLTVDQFRKIVEQKNRKAAGMNVPAEGLYLVRVKYKRGIFLD